MVCEQQIRQIFDGKSVLIAGYGREGQSSERLLKRQLPDQTIDIARNDEEIVAALKQHSYDLILKSPGIPTFRFDGLCDSNVISSQTDIFLQLYADRTIAVTGTKGKSTTTHLLRHIIESTRGHVVMAGNMGIPLFDILDDIEDDTLVVAEFSCHQLENIHRAPHIGILLNLFQEHLDHYRSYLDYQLAKFNIARCQQPGDHFFYCTDNDDLCRLVAQYADRLPGCLHPYNIKDSRARVADFETSLKGDHNLSNILVALMVSEQLGIAEADFRRALASFHGLEHRLQYVGRYRGIDFYNDSISTIPAATQAAVAALGNVDTLILGGFDRGIDYAGLATFLPSCGIRNAAFVGAAGRRMASLLPKDHELNCLFEDDYAKIVDWCFQCTRPGKVCLLSPAAASYDAFRNFEERGHRFMEEVKK